MIATENTKLKTYYTKMYPTDQLGAEISEDKTFYDLFECLDRYNDVYELIGVGDSIIRERLFEALAKIMQVPYDYIYRQWLSA